MNPYKERFAGITSLRTLADAANGADVLLGLSTKGAFTAEMIASLAPRPVVFAMANPDPEIAYEEARAVRDDIIMATGRSIIPTKSTMFSDSRLSSAERLTCTPPPSTKK